MYRIPSTLNGDLDYTQSLIDQLKAVEIQAGQLKSNRVPMGISSAGGGGKRFV
jgi:sulfite reductase (ferredoxin)